MEGTPRKVHRRSPAESQSSQVKKKRGKSQGGTAVSQQEAQKGLYQDLYPDAPIKKIKRPRWRPDELFAMIHTANKHKTALRGNFKGTADGKKRRNRAWRKVQKNTNEQSRCGRSIDECQKKLSCFTSQSKKKNGNLRSAYARTGAGLIPEHAQLTKAECMALDYLGEEAVLGISGIKPSPIMNVGKKKFLEKEDRVTGQVGWNPNRQNKPVYAEASAERPKQKHSKYNAEKTQKVCVENVTDEQESSEESSESDIESNSNAYDVEQSDNEDHREDDSSEEDEEDVEEENGLKNVEYESVDEDEAIMSPCPRRFAEPYKTDNGDNDSESEDIDMSQYDDTYLPDPATSDEDQIKLGQSVTYSSSKQQKTDSFIPVKSSGSDQKMNADKMPHAKKKGVPIKNKHRSIALYGTAKYEGPDVYGLIQAVRDPPSAKNACSSTDTSSAHIHTRNVSPADTQKKGFSIKQKPILTSSSLQSVPQVTAKRIPCRKVKCSDRNISDDGQIRKAAIERPVKSSQSNDSRQTCTKQPSMMSNKKRSIPYSSDDDWITIETTPAKKSNLVNQRGNYDVPSQTRNPQEAPKVSMQKAQKPANEKEKKVLQISEKTPKVTKENSQQETSQSMEQLSLMNANDSSTKSCEILSMVVENQKHILQLLDWVAMRLPGQVSRGVQTTSAYEVLAEGSTLPIVDASHGLIVQDAVGIANVTLETATKESGPLMKVTNECPPIQSHTCANADSSVQAHLDHCSDTDAASPTERIEVQKKKTANMPVKEIVQVHSSIAEEIQCDHNVTPPISGKSRPRQQAEMTVVTQAQVHEPPIIDNGNDLMGAETGGSYSTFDVNNLETTKPSPTPKSTPRRGGCRTRGGRSRKKKY